MNKSLAIPVLLLLASAAVGCGDDVRPRLGVEERLANQDAAEEIVWRGVYGRFDSPPPIYWRTDSRCGTGAWAYLGWDVGGKCAVGEFFPDWHVEVARSGPIGKTAYAHELCHALRFAETGDSDPGHKSACFAPGGLAEVAGGKIVGL